MLFFSLREKKETLRSFAEIVSLTIFAVLSNVTLECPSRFRNSLVS